MPIRARSAGGKFAIYTVPTVTSTDNAPLTNPLGNIGRVHFHSDLDYFEVFSDQTVTLNLPQRLISQNGTGTVQFATGGNTFKWIDHSPFQATSFPSEPYGAVQINGIFYPSWVETTYPFIGDNNGGGTRVLDARVTESGIVFREYWYNYTSFVSPYPKTSCPGVSISVRSLLFAPQTPAAGLPDLRVSASRITAGKGKLDTNGRPFLRLSPTVTGLAFTSDRTIDSMPGTMRRWNLNGTMTDLEGVYSGSYAGPTVRQVIA